MEVKTESISALEYWRDVGADLILLDWGLPGMSGIELLKNIRRSGRKVACVMITGYSDRDKILAARAHQVDAYILKPFDAQHVINTLTRVLAEAGDEPPAHTPPAASIDEYISRQLSQGALSLPIDHTLAKAAVRIREMDAEERIGVLRQCQVDPALLFRMLSLANSGTYIRGTEIVETFEAALRRIGLVELITLALELSLYPGSQLKEDFLLARRLDFQREAMSLIGIVSKLREHVEFDIASCRSACLLGRLGELTLLQIAQSWLDERQALDTAVCDRMLRKYSVRANDQIRTQWTIPFSIRERIAAIATLPEGVVRREPLVMRIAGLLHAGDPDRELPRLLSRFGLGGNIMDKYRQ